MESSVDLPVEAARKGRWIISVLENELAFRRVDDAQGQRISRSDAPKALEIAGLAMAEKPSIAARLPDKVVFNLTPDQAAVIRRWLSPLDEEYVRAIVARFVVPWSLPIGILYLVDNPWGAMTGIDGLRVAAGLSLIAIGILGRVRPRQGILLLNAANVVLIALLGALLAIREENWWRLLLVGLLVLISSVSVSLYRLINSLRKSA
jgi:hypothetical protein